jgi:catechol 2,3-dioxygenase-like lactoylglutathione lyase family enzyme
MAIPRFAIRAIVLVALALTAGGQQTGRSKTGSAAPVLRNTCLITNDVPRLVEFYTRVLRTPAKSTDSDYAEFHTGAAVLAIFSTAAQEKYIPGATRPASKKSAILEFEVADVDQEYSRLQTIVKHWVKPPTAQPWGTRSIYFRDPDGNLIDFYAWVKPRASDLRP